MTPLVHYNTIRDKFILGGIFFMSKLILLNTPIGNVGDVSSRALEAYTQGKYFFAEDTRNFKVLLNHLGVSLEGKYINSFHDHSGEGKIQEILEFTKENDVYLVSDAGSPIVSDPAYPLVKAAYEQNVEVDSISGVSSVTMALELAGLPPNPYTFVGFLPRDKSKMGTQISGYVEQGGTYIIFESPKRILKTLEIIYEVTAIPLEIVVMRELSKQYQQVVRLNTSEDSLQDLELTCKGEFIIAFYSDGQKGKRGVSDTLVLEYLAGRQSKKELSKLLAKMTSLSSKELYAQLQ